MVYGKDSKSYMYFIIMTDAFTNVHWVGFSDNIPC